MRRFILIPLLAFGTIAGYASGFHALRTHGCGHGCAWSEESWRDANRPPQAATHDAAPVAPAPVAVQQTAPAAQPQTLIIPIIVGAPAAAPQAAPTTYVIPVPTTAAAPTVQVAPAAPAPAPAPAQK